MLRGLILSSVIEDWLWLWLEEVGISFGLRKGFGPEDSFILVWSTGHPLNEGGGGKEDEEDEKDEEEEEEDGEGHRDGDGTGEEEEEKLDLGEEGEEE